MALLAPYDPVLSRFRLAMTGAGGTAVTAVFDRTVDGGITYTTVRGGAAVPITATNANVDDYEFVPAVTNTYRCRTYTAGAVLVNTFTVNKVTDLTSVWLKVPAAPFLNTPAIVVDRSDITRRARRGLFDVVGRTYPVMVGDVASSLSYTLQLLTETAAEERDLDYLFTSGEVVFLQLPSTVEHFPGGYFAVGDVSRAPTLRLSPRRVWTVPLTEVAIPGPAVVGSAYTIASMLAEYATITAVLAGNATITALLNRTGIPSDVIVP
jgi:hypothetical protein